MIALPGYYRCEGTRPTEELDSGSTSWGFTNYNSPTYYITNSDLMSNICQMSDEMEKELHRQAMRRRDLSYLAPTPPPMRLRLRLPVRVRFIPVLRAARHRPVRRYCARRVQRATVRHFCLRHGSLVALRRR